MAKLKKAPLYDLTVHSPCTNCTLTWLPNEWRISTFLIRSKKIKDYKVELEDSSGNKLEMNFYPSPTCFCELSKKYKSDFDFDLSVISPITQLDELAADNGVYLFNSIIEGRGLFSYPLFVSGYGCDMDKELATLKSKMEALERMCFYLYPRSAFRFISLSGFKKIPYWKNTSTLVEKKGQFFYTAYQINGENEMFIPASLVLPKNQVSPIFDLVVNNSSSKGMSVHFSKEAALENGLIEFIESIGNSILWSEGPRLLVDLDSLPSSSQSWIQLIYLYCEKVFITFLEPCRGFFSVTVVGFNENNSKPCSVVCSGGGRCLVDAINGGLRELYSQVHYANIIFYDDNFKNKLDPHNGFLNYLSSNDGLNLLEQWGFMREMDLYKIKAEDSLVLHSSVPESACYIDRGNPLIDSLGLTCVHVFVPELIQSHKTRKGLLFPYA